MNNTIKKNLKECGKLNPRPWIEHSINVDEAAKLIAEQTDDLDSESAREGVNEYTIPRWKSTFENKEYFEKKLGKSI